RFLRHGHVVAAEQGIAADTDPAAVCVRVHPLTAMALEFRDLGPGESPSRGLRDDRAPRVVLASGLYRGGVAEQVVLARWRDGRHAQDARAPLRDRAGLVQNERGALREPLQMDPSLEEHAVMRRMRDGG